MQRKLVFISTILILLILLMAMAPAVALAKNGPQCYLYGDCSGNGEPRPPDFCPPGQEPCGCPFPEC